jgi:hypothetical protein
MAAHPHDVADFFKFACLVLSVTLGNLSETLDAGSDFLWLSGNPLSSNNNLKADVGRLCGQTTD